MYPEANPHLTGLSIYGLSPPDESLRFGVDGLPIPNESNSSPDSGITSSESDAFPKSDVL